LTVRITVLAGKSFRGAEHFENTDYDASFELARHAVDAGDAEWNFGKMTADQLNNWYEEMVGYRPQVDDPKMTDEELRSLVIDYHSVYVEENAPRMT